MLVTTICIASVVLSIVPLRPVPELHICKTQICFPYHKGKERGFYPSLPTVDNGTPILYNTILWDNWAHTIEKINFSRSTFTKWCISNCPGNLACCRQRWHDREALLLPPTSPYTRPQLELRGLEGCEQLSQCLLSLFLGRRAQGLKCHIFYFKGKCTAWEWSLRSRASCTVSQQTAIKMVSPWALGEMTAHQTPRGSSEWTRQRWWALGVEEGVPNRSTLAGTAL